MNEGEQDAEADAEGGTEPWVSPMFDHRRERGLHERHRMHRLDALDGEIDQGGTDEIEHRKEVEVGGEAERVRDRGRDQPSDQVARDISGDVSRERTAGVHGAALFAEISERQCKGRRHA
jgi:hypothetical protein